MGKPRQHPAMKITLSSKRGTEVSSGGRCAACGKDYRVVWLHAVRGGARVSLCNECKGVALDHFFERVDALDLPHDGGQFESNRRRH